MFCHSGAWHPCIVSCLTICHCNMCVVMHNKRDLGDSFTLAVLCFTMALCAYKLRLIFDPHTFCRDLSLFTHSSEKQVCKQNSNNNNKKKLSVEFLWICFQLNISATTKRLALYVYHVPWMGVCFANFSFEIQDDWASLLDCWQQTFSSEKTALVIFVPFFLLC